MAVAAHAMCDAEIVDTGTSDSAFCSFLKSLSLEKYQDKLKKMGIESISHLADVNDTDDTDFGFMTKFEFRRPI